MGLIRVSARNRPAAPVIRSFRRDRRAAPSEGSPVCRLIPCPKSYCRCRRRQRCCRSGEAERKSRSRRCGDGAHAARRVCAWKPSVSVRRSTRPVRPCAASSRPAPLRPAEPWPRLPPRPRERGGRCESWSEWGCSARKTRVGVRGPARVRNLLRPPRMAGAIAAVNTTGLPWRLLL